MSARDVEESAAPTRGITEEVGVEADRQLVGRSEANGHAFEDKIVRALVVERAAVDGVAEHWTVIHAVAAAGAFGDRVGGLRKAGGKESSRDEGLRDYECLHDGDASVAKSGRNAKSEETQIGYNALSN